MKIVIATDHAGFKLKEKLVPFIKELGHEVQDVGAFTYNSEDDYPDYIYLAAKIVSADPEIRGIILGGSGQGEAIMANRCVGVRAVVFNGQYTPKDGRDVPHEIVISREHNDSNILSLGARFLNEEEAKTAVKQWIETPFSKDKRHMRRIEKLDDYTIDFYNAHKS